MIWKNIKEIFRIMKILTNIYGNYKQRVALITIHLLLSQVVLWVIVSSFMITSNTEFFFKYMLGAIIWISVCYFWFPYIAKNVVDHFYKKYGYEITENREKYNWPIIQRRDYTQAGLDSPDIDISSVSDDTNYLCQYKRPIEKVPDWNIFRIMLQYINDKVQGR